MNYIKHNHDERLNNIYGFQYELLDEIMDFGYPQYTEAKILSEFIKTDAYRMEVSQRPPMAVTNAVSWRSEGIRYKKNEVSFNCVICDSFLELWIDWVSNGCPGLS